MAAPVDPSDIAAFTTVALRLGMFTADVAAEIAAAAAAGGTSPSREAVRRGVLDAGQADIVETLVRPLDTVPGYEILDLLGRGGMGVVYRARQVALDRVVALKTILVAHLGDDVAVKRFERESRAVARLSHPHIVAAYDCGRATGRVWFAMELVAGVDAQRRLQEHGAFDEPTAWGIVRQAAAGLAHAAAQGLIHRDVKPANLLLLEAPAGFPLPRGVPLVKIADFGLARGLDQADDQHLTATHVAVGTPAYMAPEQLQGAEVGPAADIYALGATAYALLTGRPPHAGRTLPQIVAGHLRGEVPRVRQSRPDVSRDSDALVAALMQPDPRRRVADYPSLLAAIDRLTAPTESLASATPTIAVPHSAAADLVETTALHVPGSVATPVPDGAARRPSSPAPWLGGTWQLVALGVVAVALLAWPWLVARRTPPARALVRSGVATPLFDGTDIAGWTTRRGGWSIVSDDEGAPALAGRGLVTRGLSFGDGDEAGPPLAYYAVSCVLDLRGATDAELRFDLPSSRAGLPCLAVRLGDAGTSVVERHDEGPPRTLAGPFPFVDTATTRHGVEVERQKDGWWILVDGQPVAATSFLHELPAAEIQLAAAGGEARFSDVTLEELAPPAEH